MIEDERPGQTVVVNHTERRKNPRTPIRRLAYVNLEPYDNGGVITDLSVDGLRFHMVKPIEHAGVVRLSIFLGAANDVNAVGEIVWMDASRKVGGLRFTVLPAGAAEQILNWAKSSSTPDTNAVRRSPHDPPIPNWPSTPPSERMPDLTPAAEKENVAAIPRSKAAPEQAAQSQTARGVNTRPAWVPPSMRPAVRRATTEPPSHDLPNTATSHQQPWAQPDHSQQFNAMPWITHFDPDPPARGGSFLRGVLGGFLLCALLGSAAWFGFHHYLSPNGSDTLSNAQAPNPAASSPVAPHSDPETSDLPPNTSAASSLPADQGQMSTPQATAPSNAPSTPSDPVARANSSRALPNPAPPKAASDPQVSASTQTPSQQVPLAQLASPTTPGSDRLPAAGAPQQNAKTNASQPSLPPDAGESQLMLARQYLDGRLQPRNPMVASQLLWSAVEKGNSAAEMDLADLYLHGDGVTRNCDQARVLLSVASEKGNAEAMQKLRILNRTGCR